jgi:hypothetical protein
VSSFTHQPTLFFPGDSFHQLPFDYQAPFDQDSLSYGQTSSFETRYTPQSLEQIPAKRRKLDPDSTTMFPRYSLIDSQDSNEKGSAINFYGASVNEQQSLLARWAQPVMPSSQSLAQFPRRMAELVCGSCGVDDQSDGTKAIVLFVASPPSPKFCVIKDVPTLNLTCCQNKATWPYPRRNLNCMSRTNHILQKAKQCLNPKVCRRRPSSSWPAQRASVTTCLTKAQHMQRLHTRLICRPQQSSHRRISFALMIPQPPTAFSLTSS